MFGGVGVLGGTVVDSRRGVARPAGTTGVLPVSPLTRAPQYFTSSRNSGSSGSSSGVSVVEELRSAGGPAVHAYLRLMWTLPGGESAGHRFCQPHAAGRAPGPGGAPGLSWERLRGTTGKRATVLCCDRQCCST